MEFQPGDRVYHKRKQGYATVVRKLYNGTTLIEFDAPIGFTHNGCTPHHGWKADNDFLELISSVQEETNINIGNLL